VRTADPLTLTLSPPGRGSRRLLRLAMLLLVATACSTAAAKTTYLVSDGGGDIFLLDDLNGDGDALDVNENRLWGSFSNPIHYMERRGNAVYATYGGSDMLRFEDLNGDGDALDVNERTVFADSFTIAEGIARQGGNFFVVNQFLDEVRLVRDLNGDGDALDTNENIVWVDGLSEATGLLARGGQLFAGDRNTDWLYLLEDRNGDGDALDVVERLSYSPRDGFVTPYDLLPLGDDILVSDSGSDALFLVRDLNGDDDALDVLELIDYANASSGGLDQPRGMEHFADGGILLAEGNRSRVSLVRDLNGDGDALDVNEVVTFADGLNSPHALLAIPEPSAILLFIIAATAALVSPATFKSGERAV